LQPAETEISALKKDINSLLNKVLAYDERERHRYAEISRSFYKSAQNLLHYEALRSFDLRDIQNRLKALGLTRLANAESHVAYSLENTLFLLNCILGKSHDVKRRESLSILESEELQERHLAALLGTTKKHRRLRIMVTQPTEAAINDQMAKAMVKSGMDIARVNCAHDDTKIWKNIIDNIIHAADSESSKIMISMDLAGPKIRTGALPPGPRVKKYRAVKNNIGEVVQPAQITFTSKTGLIEGNVPVAESFLQNCKLGSIIQMRDARGKKRKLRVCSVDKAMVRVHADKTTYLMTGASLHLKANKSIKAEVGELPAIEQAILLRTGDELLLHSEPNMGCLPEINKNGLLQEPGKISCDVPEIFETVEVGDPILFDDGKIEGVVTKKDDKQLMVKIIRASKGGVKLKAEKGINFPKSNLGISGLTAKDKKDLHFIAKHADIVNYSFVNSVKDVEALYQLLSKKNALDKIGVVLKIETRKAYENLVPILLSAMRFKSVGVMIARGDLAVEIGWQHIGTVQDEILSICSAAHIPVIWATQVLENLAKTGLPSRSEITDVTSSVTAECVMLNKGPYILNAIDLLNRIALDLESHRRKKERMLPVWKSL